jgi:PAS domain S-box-containing protein
VGASPARDGEQLLGIALSSSPTPQFVLDTNHKVSCWNAALETLTGVKADEMLGTRMHWRAFYESARPCLADLLLDQAEGEIEKWYQGKSHTEDGVNEATDFFPRLGKTGKWLRFAAAAMRDSKGRTVGAVETIEDITERRLLEKRVSDLSDLKQQLLGTRSLFEKLKLITDAIVVVFGADFARIWMTGAGDLCEKGCPHAGVTAGPDVCRKRTRCLHLMASSGRYTHIDGGHRRVPLGCYKIGRVASGEEPWFITNDVTNDSRVHDREWAKSLGLVAFAGYRLVAADGAPIGVMALFRDRAIEPAEGKQLESLANTTSQVILAGMAQEALRQEEERHRRIAAEVRDLYEHAPCGYHSLDKDGVIVRINETELSWLGYSREEIVGKKRIFDIITPKSLHDFQESYPRFKERGWVRDLESEMVRKDGTVMPILLSATAVKDASGNFVMSRSTVYDIAERKKTEAALEQSLSLLRATLESTADGILVVDASGRMAGFNERFAQLWRLPQAILASRDDKQALDFVLSQLKDPKGFLAKVEQLYTQPDSDSFDVLEFKDGRVFERYSQPQRVQGRPVGRVWSFRDVTERKQAEEERSRLFNHSLDMLCIAGFDGYLKQVNPAWIRTLGWTEPELLTSPWVEFVHPEDLEATVAAGKQLAVGEPVLGFENRYRCRDGSYRWFSWNSFPLPEEGLIFAVIRDVTEFKKMEERLRQAEKMEAIGQLAGGVAHDFNNQLTGVMGYAEMLSNRLEDESLRRYAELIVGSAKRAAELTRQLLAFARKGKFQSVPVDTHKVIGDVASLLRHTVDRRIVIMQTLKANPPLTLGDPTQIQNALLNLALNARDAMPKGGELILATDVVVLDEEYCRSNPYEMSPGRYLRICVTDNGVGMSEEVRRHLFEPFFTTKGPGKGTGMGLASVYGTVKNHRGAINVYSEPDHGTTVRIYLPLLESAGQAQTPAELGEPIRGTARILVVDDEEVVLKLASETLSDLGYQVATCRNGAEAVAYYGEKWRSIDLVILDMVMPALGGRETFLAMRQINPAVRAILSSGYSLNGQAQAILDDGVLDFVQKPFQLHELSSKVAAALRRNDGKADAHSTTEG